MTADAFQYPYATHVSAPTPPRDTKEPDAVYSLELVTGKVDYTTWWKDCHARGPANVWWLTGKNPKTGSTFTSRPATDVEVELWKRLQGMCLKHERCSQQVGHAGGCDPDPAPKML